MSERKSVTRGELAVALADALTANHGHIQHETSGLDMPVNGISRAIFDALHATPAASGEVYDRDSLIEGGRAVYERLRPAASGDVEAAVTTVCDLLWEHGVYMKDSKPLARAIVAAIRAESAGQLEDYRANMQRLAEANDAYGRRD